jgi:acid phosphatase/tartrate-resistant acid phosphatase type 5
LFGGDGVFRAALIGDGGSRPADPAARALVARVAEACAEGPACDAAVLLGDNFYGLGVFGPVWAEGPMMRRRFHERFAEVALPFFAVLGNHEYASPSPLASVRHTARHPEAGIVTRKTKAPVWVQPFRYFAAYDPAGIELLFLDTYPLIGGDPLPALRARELAWLRAHCAATPGRRRVAFGHHPAATFGRYFGVFSELLSAETMDVLLTCGVRTYASGHDHHLQRIDVRGPEGDVFQQIVSGKGGEVRSAYPFSEAREAVYRWGGAEWMATLLPDHTGGYGTNAYAGWADLRVGAAIDVRLETVEP